MISFVARVKPFCAVTERVLKAGAFRFLFSTFQRVICTEYILLDSMRNKKIREFNLKNHFHSRSVPKNFGKVVELEEDFNELKVEREIEKKNNRRNIAKTWVSSNKGEKEVEEEEVEEMNESKNSSEDTRTYRSMYKNAAMLNSLITKLKCRKNNDKRNEILLEGKRLIYEAVQAGLTPVKVFFCRSSDLQDLGLPEGTELYRIPYKSCQLWADVVTPQGVIGIFEMPEANTLKVKPDSLPLTLICDNVRDPGNLGSIIRVAAGVGCEKLILTPGCTNVWHPKVVRAGAGAHFSFPILKNCVWENIENLISDSTKVFIADSQSGLDFNRKSCNFTKISNISGDLQAASYYSVEFENKSTTIVIGGETHGISDEAYKFARKRNGSIVFIPLKNNIESLNNSVALSILAFEFKRQLLLKAQKVCQSAGDVINYASAGS